jgi:hypothetical protein
MKREVVYHKMEYYAQWYMSLTDQEKDTWLGQWIIERMEKYFRALLP